MRRCEFLVQCSLCCCQPDGRGGRHFAAQECVRQVKWREVALPGVERRQERRVADARRIGQRRTRLRQLRRQVHRQVPRPRADAAWLRRIGPSARTLSSSGAKRVAGRSSKCATRITSCSSRAHRTKSSGERAASFYSRRGRSRLIDSGERDQPYGEGARGQHALPQISAVFIGIRHETTLSL